MLCENCIYWELKKSHNRFINYTDFCKKLNKWVKDVQDCKYYQKNTKKIICYNCKFGEIIQKEKYRPLFATSKRSQLVYEDSVICKKLHRAIRSISYYTHCRHKIEKTRRSIQDF